VTWVLGPADTSAIAGGTYSATDLLDTTASGGVTGYLLGRGSLVPAVVTHFLNSATAVPWILFFMVTGR